MKTCCVFCGSSSGRGRTYTNAARALGHSLAAQNLGLVYGGASIGLMGTVADSVLEKQGRVTGVIPQCLNENLNEGNFSQAGVAHRNLTELIAVSTMHERKRVMAERADGFIVLPGGVGTLEEFFEIWTWNQLGIHSKPFGLLNVDGYFDALLLFLDHARQEQFVSPDNRQRLIVETQPEQLIQRLVQASAVSGE